jgi:CheY-like chemotaxis protein
MKRVYLFQKDKAEARKRIKQLKKLGYQVRHEQISPESLRKFKEKPPMAVLIDLSRAPSLGRDAGIYIRHYRATRKIPIVFIDGEPKKVAQIKKHLPDAVYTEWPITKRALKRAITCPPAAPVKPKSLLAGYSRTPLVKKLGIKAKSAVILINAPRDFVKSLGMLPDGIVTKTRLTKNSDMMIWFTKSRKAMGKRINTIAALVGKGGLWIVWPKKTSLMATDLSQKDVREIGLNAGLVDYKVCAIDETWAGLKFARRK